MPYINSTQFGEIVINDKKYHQVLIIGDKIEERDYKKLEELFNTSHKIGDWEIEKLTSNNSEIIVIGTGQDGAMAPPRLSDFPNIELIVAKTPEAIKIYNEKVKEGKKVNALIHTTC